MSPWRSFTFFCATTATAKPSVAISACLNGEAVRYDGADKFLQTTSTLLAKHLTLLPICPEVGAGLSVPRAPVQLVQNRNGLEALGRDDNSLNVTAALHQFRQQSLRQLQDHLCGYIVKSRSPSCGIDSTPIFNQAGQQIATGSGLQAGYFQQQLPWLAFADEHQLQSARQCERFIMRCLLVHDLRQGIGQAGLAAVHRHYFFLTSALDDNNRRRLQRAVADDDADDYRSQLLTIFSQQKVA